MCASKWASGCPRAASFSWVIPAHVSCTWLTALLLLKAVWKKKPGRVQEEGNGDQAV